jgi:FkbM family methyltransferase
MSLFTTLKAIVNHPLNAGNKFNSLLFFFKWQISTRLIPYPIVYEFTNKAKLIIQKGMTGATQNLYCGLHDFNDMFFLLHFLRENDLFVDIGANVGSYTVLGAAHVAASVIAIEPVPATFAHLQQNIRINQLYEKVKTLNIALGSEAGKIYFTSKLDTENHVAVGNEADTFEVAVQKLDEVLAGKLPLLLKIDVEGFETEVLNGAATTLQNSSVKAIIIELNGLGKRYGFDENLVHQRLLDNNFQPYTYNPFLRQLTLCPTFGNRNTIYLRDIPFVTERIKTAEKVYLRKKLI